MALLQGSGGTTGKRVRVDRQRSSDSESGPVLRSLLPGSGADAHDLRDAAGSTGATDLRVEAELRVDRGLSLGTDHRDDSDNRSRISGPALEAALLRLAAAGPTAADVLGQLAQDAALLLDAPARVALATDDRLVWMTGSADAEAPTGVEVDVDRTACGAAWQAGLIQTVTTPTRPSATNVISLDRPQLTVDDPGDTLTTACCGSPAVVLAVPLLREAPTVAGRHAGFFREVFAVLALSGERAGWFDDDDIEASADLAEVAGERIAALALSEANGWDAPESPVRRPAPNTSPGPDPGAGSTQELELEQRPGGHRHGPAPRTTRAHSTEATGTPPEAESTPAVRPSGISTRTAPDGIAVPGRRKSQGPDEKTSSDAGRNPARSGPMVLPRSPGDQDAPVARDASTSAMPPAAASVTVVPTARPGRSGFGGWFARSKNASVEDVPSPRSGRDRGPAAELLPTETEPASIPPAVSAQPSARAEWSGSEASAEAVLASIEPVPRRLASSAAITESGAPETPGARLTRARTRPTATPSAPPSMPASDSMGLWQWDAADGEFTWSSPVARLLGLPAGAELSLAAVREAVVAADRGRFDAAVRAVTSGRDVAGAVRLRTPDGQAKHAYAWSEVRRDGAGQVAGAWGGVVDVTAFEHDAAALRSGLAGLRAAQELTGLATWEWRADTEQLLWSDEMYRLAGVSEENFVPTPEGWHAFVHPDDLARARRLDLGADLDAGPDGERVETFRLIGRGGEIRHVQSWSATSGDRVVYGATLDVTRQVHDRMTLERLSATDPVTGLGNRLAFDRRMQQLLSNNGSTGSIRPAGPGRSVTLILLDLDRFKVVNDSLGHQVGDRLLIEVARRLVAVVPEGSVTARMGGDEFVVVPPLGGTEDEVRRLAGSVVEALRAPYVLPETGELLVCPASLGVARSEGRRVTGHDLLREADIALYRAKDSGRDQFVVFDEALKARTKTRQRAERRLRTALEEGRLVMQYQPIVDFAGSRVIGAEALVRLHDTEDGDRLVSPDLFLDIAEQTGLVVEIDCWVIETAIAQLMRWTGLGGEPCPWLAINLSARSLEHPRVVRRLIEAVKRGEVDRDRIKIELTEQSFIGTLPGVDAGVRQLIAAGIGVGIDDFGTGYSALAYLQHFDLDFMKIDRAFVTSVGEGPRGDAVVTAIVDLAHAHGMRVIAEGVESGRQARRLREIGCDFAQGFHFGRPGEADRIVRG